MKYVKKSLTRRVLHENGKATGVMYVDLRTGIEYIQPADVVVLGIWKTYSSLADLRSPNSVVTTLLQRSVHFRTALQKGLSST